MIAQREKTSHREGKILGGPSRSELSLVTKSSIELSTAFTRLVNTSSRSEIWDTRLIEINLFRDKVEYARTKRELFSVADVIVARNACLFDE